MFDGLHYILDKKIVVPTVNADDLTNNATQVDEDYTTHAYTFIPMGPVDEIADRLIKQVVGRKTIKGMLIAPYGYGKTSTLVFLWYRCHRQALLAVPPFYCSTLLDILRSTYAWARYRFKQEAPALLPELDSLYQRHYGATLEDRARAYAQEFGITEQAALGILRQQQASGEYRIQLTATSLQAFLAELAPLANQAGFRGLVIFPDEFQAFLGKTENVRQALQSVREFVWGLMSSKAPLGVLISADDTTEGRIQSGGGDILDRLRADGFYLNLKTIYDQSFPASLWERYCEAFKLPEPARGIIDGYTLRALGQIAEREDLSRGPRTVIDALKGAIRHHKRTGRSYTPMDLIDDFLEDRIRFEGNDNRISLRQVTKQALDVSSVTTPERQQAVKLMAAFPRGVTEATHRRYSLTNALNDLSKGGGHGELMTLLIDGYTLLGLQRTGDGGRHVVDRIIQQYGREYEADEVHAEAARRAFTHHILNKLFATRRGGMAVGWDALKMTDSAKGSTYGVVEGSFSPNYPRRILAIQVAHLAKQLVQERDEHDLQFDFLLHWQDSSDGTGTGRIEPTGEHTVQWHLALKHPLEGEIPSDIRKLQQFVNPAFISPLLLLALCDFIERWETERNEPIPERDQPEIKLLLDRLVERAMQMLFNQGLHQSWSRSLKRAGQGLVEEVFNDWMSQHYPLYTTFFNHAQYEEVQRKYQDAIKDLSKKQARGHAPIKDNKNVLAKRFGVDSVATFENRLDTAYKAILKKVSWSGGEGELRCLLHPLEQQIWKQLQTEGSTHSINGMAVRALPTNVIAREGGKFGYRLEEILLAFQLLLARRMIGLFRGEQNLIYIPIDTLNVETLQATLAAEHSRLHDLPSGLLPQAQLEFLESQAAQLNKRLDAEPDEEELDEINHQIGELREQLTAMVIEQHNELERQLRTHRSDVEESLASLRRIGDLLEPTFQGQVAFVQHLSDLRLRLMQEFTSVKRELEAERASFTSILDAKTVDPVTSVLELQKHFAKAVVRIGSLSQRRDILREHAEGLSRWRELLRQADTLFSAPGLPSDLRTQLTHTIVPFISEHLVKRRFDGLKDWELFRQKLEELNHQYSQRQTAGNQAFGQRKDEYAKLLRDMNIGQAALRARYEYGADDESYQDLFNEIEGKIRARLDEIHNEHERISSDLIRVEYLQRLDTEQQAMLQALKRSHRDLAQELQRARSGLTTDTVREHKSALITYSEQVRALDGGLGELRKMIDRLRTIDTARSQSEDQLMSLMQGRNDYDLAQLFLSLRREREVELAELLELLRDLFKKGQIEVKVRRRSS